MLLRVFSNKKSLGQAAAEQAAVTIRRAIAEQGRARIIAATNVNLQKAINEGRERNASESRQLTSWQ